MNESPKQTSVCRLNYIGTTIVRTMGRSVTETGAAEAHRFGICVQADLEVYVPGGSDRGTTVRAGELFYVPAGASYAIRNLSASDAEARLIGFGCEDEAGRAVPLLEGRGGHTPAPLAFKLPQARGWLPSFRADAGGGRAARSDELLLLSRLYAIAAACVTAAAVRAGRTGQDLARLVEYVKSVMLEHYDTPLDMEELARGSGVGANRFYRAFRERTGLSPLKYLTAVRLDASLKLLADPAVTVAEAAHAVGYADEFYFSRLFKKTMGMAPTEFAARARVRVAALCGVFVGDLAVLGLTPCVTAPRDWERDRDARLRCYDALRRAEPTLILTGPLPDDVLEALAEIAPVHPFRWTQYSWQRRLLDFGRLLGIESAAAYWLSDYRLTVDNARRHAASCYPDQPFVLIGVRSGNFRLYGKRRRKLTDIFYEELGFAAPPSVEQVEVADSPGLEVAAGMDCDNAIFLMEYAAEDEEYVRIEREWIRLREGRRGACLFVRLGEPFLYNAAMHRMLVDRTVGLLFPGETRE